MRTPQMLASEQTKQSWKLTQFYLLATITITIVVILIIEFQRISITITDVTNYNHEKFLTDLIPKKTDKTVIALNHKLTDLKEILLPNQYSIDIYLKVLQNSISIVTVQELANYHLSARQSCVKTNKKSVYYNQHSVELRIPNMLKEMDLLARKSNDTEIQELSILWNNNHDHIYHSNNSNEPLLHYFSSCIYMIAYCTFHKNNKEYFRKAERYVEEAAKYLTEVPSFQTNMGIDFLSAATHPKGIPIKSDPASFSAYQRQTFLRVDYEFNGFAPRDIIIPYYVRSYHDTIFDSNHSMEYIYNSTLSDDDVQHDDHFNNALRGSYKKHSKVYNNKKLLLFFSGGRNPVNGYREQFEKKLQEYLASKATTELANRIYYSTNSINKYRYIKLMAESEFCLSVRGDTSSSSRLFQSIDLECIPVIIADWIILPYEEIIDYSKFLIVFPESILHNIGYMIDYLQSIKFEDRERMRKHLKAVRPLLLYEPCQHTLYTLNPVTLFLIEAIKRRKDYCDSIVVTNVSTMCINIANKFRQVIGKLQTPLL